MTGSTWIPIPSDTKKRLWIAVLTSIGVLVLCAMVPLTFTRLGSPDSEIVATIALMAGLTFMGVLAIVTWHIREAWITTVLGFLAGVTAFGTTLAVVWYGHTLVYDPSFGVYRRWYYPLLGSSWVLAMILPASNLLTLARLPESWRFVRFFALVCIWSFALVVLLAVSKDYIGFRVREDDLLRLATCLGLAGFFGVVFTFALHFRFRMKEPSSTPIHTSTIAAICPACGLSQPLPLGDSACSRCRIKFHIEVEAPTCPKCGYLCFQLTSDRCPECGTELAMVSSDG